jgi:hypothetical protein
MAKRPEPGKCVHCLRDPVERNWDHVFSRSWYPESSKPNEYKWQIPSCLPCNSALGKIEEDFLRRIALTLDPDNSASRGLIEKALRSMNASAGKNEKDSEIRERLRQRVLADVIEGEAIPTIGIFPGLEERWGRPREEQAGVLIPANSFRRLTEKIARGIFWIEDRRFIEPPYKIEFSVLPEGNPVQEVLDLQGTTYAREPGVVVRRFVTPEDGVSSLFEIQFWQQFKTYASVLSD